MSIRVIFFLVTAIYLAQYSVGKPTTEDVEDKRVHLSVDSNEFPSLSKDKEVIRNIIRAEVIKSINQRVQDETKRIEAIVAELTEMDEKSEDMKAIIDDLSKIRNKLTTGDVQDSKGEEWMGVFKKMSLLAELQLVEYKYIVKLRQNPTDEVILLGKIMKKHNPVITQEDLNKRQLEFIEKCEEAVAEYFNSLTSKEQEDRKEMSDWLQEFKEETDVYKKSKKLDEFLPELAIAGI